jgi:hypothetical protein
MSRAPRPGAGGSFQQAVSGPRMAALTATGNACPVRAPRSQQVHTVLDDLGAPLTASGR